MRDRWKSFATLLRVTVASSPLAAAVELALVALIALAGPMLAWSAAAMVDAIGADRSVQTAGTVLIIAIGIVLTGQAAVDAARYRMEDAIELTLQSETMDLAMAPASIAHHETPELADRLGSIREDFRRLKGTAGTLGSGVTVIVATGTTLVLLAGVHPLLLMLPLVGGFRLWTSAAGARKLRHAMNTTIEHERRQTVLQRIAAEPQHGLEIRSYGLRGLLASRIAELYRRQNGPRWQATAWTARREIVSRLVFGLAFALAIALVVWQAREGRATAGDVILVLLLAPQIDQSAQRLSESVHSLVAMLDVVDNIRRLRAYVADQAGSDRRHRERVALSTARTRVPEWTSGGQLRRGIELRHVSFAYPGRNHSVLRDVSVLLPAGSTVALVGENGAGKTTLVKLLAGLYRPTGGSIHVDGTDVASIDPPVWRKGISVGFQDFVRYEFTAREAIGLGEPRLLGDAPEATAHRFEAAMDAGDARGVIESLDAGLDTRLGTRFGGTGLSGGQWQRIALARAFVRRSPWLLLLDEPTSAIDPETEYGIVQRFTAASAATRERRGVVVIVSHRLSTVRFADMILVFEKGRLAEVGSHSELVARNGAYAELFKLQADAYR
jgi:ATP-binding cassette subfamily B protein